MWLQSFLTQLDKHTHTQFHSFLIPLLRSFSFRTEQEPFALPSLCAKVPSNLPLGGAAFYFCFGASRWSLCSTQRAERFCSSWFSSGERQALVAPARVVGLFLKRGVAQDSRCQMAHDFGLPRHMLALSCTGVVHSVSLIPKLLGLATVILQLLHRELPGIKACCFSFQ